MPLHIESLTSQVRTQPDSPSWTNEDLDRIADLVAARLDRRRRAAALLAEATDLWPDAGGRRSSAD
ncbi:hypothetical protein JOF56_009259 [Kibdelosporangium banguiense]|uniref:Uncharacterized protein n=1 Tax=Kibdelosporangium banguiense TaxID=1365924 RepID=A0ABS4TWU6_9PSEU|nr:hypothetical protein [Kibdelosporangium banguiense]MBP2328874.1 hypothetical protein [Kibdelosporangium banguiense]